MCRSMQPAILSQVAVVELRQSARSELHPSNLGGDLLDPVLEFAKRVVNNTAYRYSYAFCPVIRSEPVIRLFVSCQLSVVR